MEYEPGSCMAWCNMGNIHKNAGNLEGAIECYEKALRVGFYTHAQVFGLSIHAVVYPDVGFRFGYLEKFSRLLKLYACISLSPTAH